MPGTSGNLKGRPKRLTLSEFAEKLLRTQRTRVTITEGGKTTTVTMSKKRALVERLIQRALQGDMRVIEYLGDRIDPKVKTVEAGGDSGPTVIRLPSGGPWGGRADTRQPEPPSAAAGGAS